MIKFSIISLILILCCFKAGAQNSRQTTPYKWKSVRMVGGGFVDGIVFHPTAKGIRYCRTDIGGAYRWNDEQQTWEPMLDWVSDKDNNLMGVESIALDIANPERVYLACGTYTSSKGPNAILRSDDRGKTFKRTDVPFKMGGNENGRGNGERMAVDPNNGNIIYMGTRKDGLWKSTDGAVSWNRVNSFPAITDDGNTTPGRRYQPNGIVFIKFDPKSGSKGKLSNKLYAGVSLKGKSNLFRSTDGGENWQPITGEPVDVMPARATLATDGNLYMAYASNPGPNTVTNGAIWKLNTNNNTWTDITPDKPDALNNRQFGYAAVSVDAQHPQTLIVSSFNRYGKLAGGEDIFRSIDGGKSWKTVFTGSGKGKFDYGVAPYVAHTGIHWLFDIEIDPLNSDHAVFTTGYGGHETFNLTAMDKGEPTLWHDLSAGIEETVALDMISPPQGAALISAIGDYGGFVHWNLDQSAPEGNFTHPHFSNTNSIAFAENEPQIIVRVGEGSTHVGGGNIGYSLNGGKSWQSTLSVPQTGSKGGHVTVSANGKTWIWTPQNNAAYLTKDNGATWVKAMGLPDNTPVVADSKNPDKFYAINLFNGQFFKSTDGGVSFIEQPLNLTGSSAKPIDKPIDKRQGTNQIYTTPGMEGDIWLVTLNGLYHSTNGGAGFFKTGSDQEVRAFGFGKPAPGVNYPALYIIANVNGKNCVYRSDDIAKNWSQINDEDHQWGLLLHITGDPKVYGRVYVGTHGRGILYGDPVK